jgi:nucleoside 2-deoxyribosyltransferase
MTDQRRQVFLSYPLANQELADLVIPVIRSSGFDVELPGERATGSTEIADTTREQISSSDLVIMLVTPIAIASPWLPFETGMARAFDTPVVVLYEGLTPDQLPEYLSEFRTAGVSQISDVLRTIDEKLKVADT